MESSPGNPEMYGRMSNNTRRFGIQIPESNFIRAPLTAFLEHTGIFGGGSSVSQATRGFVGSRHSLIRSSRDSLQEEKEEKTTNTMSFRGMVKMRKRFLLGSLGRLSTRMTFPP